MSMSSTTSSRTASPGRRLSGVLSGVGTPRTNSSRRPSSGIGSARPQSAGGNSLQRSQSLGQSGVGKRSSASNDKVDGRVRVAVRLRPVLPHEEAEAEESAQCIEVEPEVHRVLIKKNHWDSEPYQFDDAFPGTTSQRRLYEEFCQPVVESVLKGYNGTVMAYGQTGTGKTYTLGNLGSDNASQRGIILRSMDNILQHIKGDMESRYKVTLSYLQLYMECVLDLLEPNKDQLHITEDPNTGEINATGAKVVQVTQMDSVRDILKIGEENRVVANQKLNATSSRSHSLLIINIHRVPKEKAGMGLVDSVTVTKSKLLLVDLAGSERISKSGSEGQTLEEAKFINLSLTALGKCINALSENNVAHIPYRDSKLTRMMKDSFGGTARTSLIVCASPLRGHINESQSALLFGQRAMKIENNTRIREEVDLRLLNYRLQAELDKTNNLYEVTLSSLEEVAAEASEDKKLKEQMQVKVAALEQQILAEKSIQESIQQQYRQMLSDREESIREEVEDAIAEEAAGQLAAREKAEARVAELEAEVEKYKVLASQASSEAQSSLKQQLETAESNLTQLKLRSQQEVESLTKQLGQKDKLVEQLQAAMTSTSEHKSGAIQVVLKETREEVAELKAELKNQRLETDESISKERERSRALLDEVSALKSQLAQEKARVAEAGARESKGALSARGMKPPQTGTETMMTGADGGTTARGGNVGVWNQHRDAVSAVSKLFEHVGLTTVFGLLKYDDRDVRLHAVKVIANLAAEEENQVNIVQEGGLEALFELLQTCSDEMTLRVAAGAIANLAMSEVNQHRIVEEGGLKLLVKLSQSAADSQTQRMIAGAIANLCGNANILDQLHGSGSLQVLINMSYSEHVDVLSQVARGFANNSKCTKGKTHLVELGAMPAILHLASKKTLTTVRKHAMLALCQIASCAANVLAVRSSGAFRVLTDIASSPHDEFKQMAATVVSNPIYA